jgi:hypothetical protein
VHIARLHTAQTASRFELSAYSCLARRYETEEQAAEAKYTLHGFKITPTNAMTIAYAKK